MTADPPFDLSAVGLANAGPVHRNLSAAALGSSRVDSSPETA